MELPTEVVVQLDKLEESLDNLAGFLQPFLDATPRELDESMPPLERARAHVTLARSVELLARLRLRLRGVVLEEGHPLVKEQERLERYEAKLRRAVLDDESARTRPGTALNLAATNRFITAAIPDLTEEQRAALKAAGAAGGGGAKRRQQPGGGRGGSGGGKRPKGGAGSSGDKQADMDEILAAAAGVDDGGDTE